MKMSFPAYYLLNNRRDPALFLTEKGGIGDAQMKSKIQNPKHRFCHLLFVICALSFVILTSGCEGFARKFVRKHKPEENKTEEIVLVPQEYKAGELSKEELYRQYFLYWQSWQDELIDSLSSPNPNRKKQIDCLREAVKNLVDMKGLLKPEKQKLLENYINEMNNLRQDITKDVYENSIANNLMKAQRIKRNIHRDLSFTKIKDCLI